MLFLNKGRAVSVRDLVVLVVVGNDAHFFLTFRRRVLGLMLRTAGFSSHSTVVGDGLAVTELLAKDCSAFDVIVLDANMVHARFFGLSKRPIPVAKAVQSPGLLSADKLTALPPLPNPFRPHVLQGGGDSDGLPTLFRIKDLFANANRPCPPVVFLTGEAERREHERYKEAGAIGVVVKPITLEGLREIGKSVILAPPVVRVGSV